MSGFDLDEAAGDFARSFAKLAAELNKPDEPVTPTGWRFTDKMKPTGDGHRDRLVAARLNLRAE